MNRFVGIGLLTVASFALGYVVRGTQVSEPVAQVGQEVSKTPLPAAANPVAERRSAGVEAPAEIPPVLAASADAPAATQVESPQSAPQRSSSATPNSQVEFMRRQLLTRMKKTMAGFFEGLGMTEEQIDELSAALVDAQYGWYNDPEFLKFRERMMSGEAADEDRQAMHEYVQERRAETDAAQRAILGSNYDAYKEYERTVPHTQRIESLESSLQNPLYSSTKDELLRIFVEESKSPANAETLTPGSSREDVQNVMKAQLESTRANHERIKLRARSYLDEAQYAALVVMLDNEVERQEIMNRMRELTPQR